MSNKKTEPEIDPAALPFGAAFAEWVRVNVKADIIAAKGDPGMALRRVIGKHSRLRADAGLGAVMEDMLADAISQLAEYADGWRNQAARLRSDLERARPLAFAPVRDLREFHETNGAIRALVSATDAVVAAYVATAEKLAIISDAERERAAALRTERMAKRNEVLSAMTLAELRTLAGDENASRKAPLVGAILVRERPVRGLRAARRRGAEVAPGCGDCQSRRRGVVKAISVRQPWAWAILHAAKRHENRGPSWARVRIPPVLALHAAKGCTREEYADAVETIQAIVPGVVVPPLAELPRGGLVGVMRMGPTVECEERTMIHRSDRPWLFGPVGLTILDVEALPFVPLKGMLGLFETAGTAEQRPSPEVCSAWVAAIEKMKARV